jgi:hypothetical protein
LSISSPAGGGLNSVARFLPHIPNNTSYVVFSEGLSWLK